MIESSSAPPPAPALLVPESPQPSSTADFVQLPAKWAWLVAVLAAAGLVTSGLLWQKLGNIQEELARRSTDAGAQSIEARALAKSAQDGVRDISARLAIQETRIGEVSLQRSQLEELMQSLSRSRDENLVVDVESALRLAQQQAQLTGSAEPLIAALKSADLRLSRAAQPRLNPLQRAIVKDMDRIRSATLTDVPVLLVKLDELSRLVDELPVANAMSAGNQSRVATSSAAASSIRPSTVKDDKTMATMLDRQALQAWLHRFLNSVHDEARRLLRVSRIEQPEAALMAPEQAFFMRENLKLRLLNARLSLLSRQTETARADLAASSIWMGKYFDPASRKTQAATQLLQQVQGQLKTSELPRLDDTMAALATAAAGR